MTWPEVEIGGGGGGGGVHALSKGGDAISSDNAAGRYP